MNSKINSLKLPNKLIFGSKVINIKYITKKTAHQKKIFGQFNSDKNEIIIDKSLDQINLINTFIHEILHLLFDEYNIEISAKLEEITCNNLTNGICHLLFQNPIFLELLYNSLKKD